MSDDPRYRKPMRRPDGTILPGTGALNPGGRPQGIERQIRELVSAQIENWDGKSLDGWAAMTLMMYSIAMGKTPPGKGVELDVRIKDRMAAVQFLFDRVHGKPTVKVESDTTITNGGIANLNVDGLSQEELDALESHVELLAAKAAGKATGSVIDIPGDDDE